MRLYDYEVFNKLLLDTSVTGTNITDDQADFPVCIHITADTFTEAGARTDFFSATNIDGKRMNFFMANDYSNPLDYQVIKWDVSGQEGIYFVKLPEILGDNDVDNLVFIAYSAYDGLWPDTAQDNAEHVWSNNYLAVYHFNPTADFTDSLGGQDLTNVGTTSETSRLDAGRGFNGASGLNAPHEPTYSLPIGSISGLLKIPDTSGGLAIIAEKLNGGVTGEDPSAIPAGWRLYVSTGGKLRLSVYDNAEQDDIIGSTVIDDGSTHRFVAGTFNGTELKLFLNDAQDATPVASTIVPGANIEKLSVGYDSEDAESYLPSGSILDELRLHAIARSDDWMVLEDWSTRRSTYIADGWLTYGNQEAVPEETIPTPAETVVVKDGIIVAIQNAAPVIFGEYIKDGSLTIPKFADEVTAFIAAEGKKIEAVEELPALPDDEYPDGAIVSLAPENFKLYRSLGETWTAAIEAIDITGSILTGQIAANAIVAQLLAADSVIAGKIAAGAIQAGALQADSVLADNIIANAITTPKIIAEAITAAKLATGSVTTEKLDAESVTANKLAAGSIIAGKIAVDAIVANDGVIGSAAIGNAQIADLSADKITAGTINADEVTIASQNNKTVINDEGITVEKQDDPDVSVKIDANAPDGRIVRITKGALSIEDEDEKIIIDKDGMVADGIVRGIMPGTNNPIKNSSFEKIDANNRPLEWTRTGAGKNNISTYAGDFKFGTRCFQCDNVSPTYAKASQDVSVKANTDYKLSFYYKCDLLGIISAFGSGIEHGDGTKFGEGTEIGTQGGVIRIYDEAGTTLLAESAMINGTETAWTRSVVDTFNTGSDDTIKIQIWVGEIAYPLAGELMIDAIMLNEGAVVQAWSLSIHDWLDHTNDETIHVEPTQLTPCGAIMEWPTYIPPESWLILDGSEKSRTTYADLSDVLMPEKGQFDVTEANPAVVSLTAHGLQIGDSWYATTTGSLPTGMSENTLYYVITAGFTADSFQFSETRGGTAFGWGSIAPTAGTNDGYAEDSNAVWATARAGAGNSFNISVTDRVLASYNAGGQYTIDRISYGFNTSAIPDTAIITKIKLKIKCKSIDNAGEGMVFVETTSTLEPINASSDYAIANWGTVEAGRCTAASWAVGEYNIITVDPDVITINKTGTTWIGMRGQHDFDNSQPGGATDRVGLYFANSTGNEPILEVTYYI